MSFKEEVHTFLRSQVSKGPKTSDDHIFVPATPADIEFLKKIDFYLSLKPTPLPRPDIDDPTKVMGRIDNSDIYVRADFKGQVEGFFRRHILHEDQKEQPLVYKQLFTEVGKFLEHEDPPGITLWQYSPGKESGIGIKGDYKASRAKEVAAVDQKKPVVIYLGGVLEIDEKEGFVDRALNRIGFLLKGVGISETNYNIYGITYDSGSSFYKTASVNAYNGDPFNYKSPQAVNFVEQVLVPLFTAPDSEGSPKRLPNKWDVVEQFSKVTFVAYSYGTVFLQEVRNALVDKMREVGYRDDEIKFSIPNLAGVCISSTCKIVEKGIPGKLGNITQLHICSSEDVICNSRTNNHKLVENDPNPNLKYWRSANTMFLMGYGVGKKATSVRIEYEEKDPGRNWLAEILAQPERAAEIIEESEPRTRIIDTSQSIMNGHHPVVGMRTDKFPRSDFAYTVQIHPGAHIVVEFLNHAINESFRACSEDAVRKSRGRKLLDDAILSPDQRDAEIAKMDYTRKGSTKLDKLEKDELSESARVATSARMSFFRGVMAGLEITEKQAPETIKMPPRG